MFKHRHWGIPNLMMYISIGAAIVYIMSLVNGGGIVYSSLCFDKGKILEGQVWRLFTYVFTFSLGSGPIMTLIGLLCTASLGNAIERVWGTFRFNLFYLTGVVLMDIFAMIFCPTGYDPYDYYLGSYYTVNIAYFLNLTLVICYATMFPDARFLIMFILPVKAWILALVYLGLNVIEIYNLASVGLFPHCLFPVVGFLNYVLFVGKNVIHLFPVPFRVWVGRLFRKKPKKQNSAPIHFRPDAQKEVPIKAKASYNHRCTVCGRTDTSHPDLEFRYCSRCSGYHCYCEDHINNHNHITE